MSNNLIDVPLSAQDILQFVNECKILRYTELLKYQNIDDLLAPFGVVFILYETVSDDIGHWVVLFRRNKNTLEFFDPLGFFVDDELKMSPYLQQTLDGIKYLTYLMMQSHYTVVYNKYPFQKDYTKTCGRWCVHRYLNKKKTLDEYYKMWEGVKMRDYYVANLIK